MQPDELAVVILGNDRALRYLGESLGPLKEIITLLAKSDPDFENLREDSRFSELIGELACRKRSGQEARNG